MRGFASLDDLVRELGVSESTIRRDLDALEEQGSARRTHGGVLYAGGHARLPEFDERQPSHWAAKRAIAAAAAERIDDGETVLLDGGTTTYEVARLLVGRSIQVVTNSLPVANLFASESRADLVLLGGYVSPRTGVCLGPYANELLGRLHVTTTVLSAAGITAEGLYNAPRQDAFDDLRGRGDTRANAAASGPRADGDNASRLRTIPRRGQHGWRRPAGRGNGRR